MLDTNTTGILIRHPSKVGGGGKRGLDDILSSGGVQELLDRWPLPFQSFCEMDITVDAKQCYILQFLKQS